MSRLITVLVTILLVGAALATAGPEKIAFPAKYKDFVRYTTVDRVDIKEVRDIYINPEAAKLAKAGQPLPSGTILTMVHFKAKVDYGELVKDANGRLIRGAMDRIGVMEKRTGWGAEYPADLRNGEWEYALFSPDGKFNEKANYKACFQCHIPKKDQVFVFTSSQVGAATK